MHDLKNPPADGPIEVENPFPRRVSPRPKPTIYLFPLLLSIASAVQLTAQAYLDTLAAADSLAAQRVTTSRTRLQNDKSLAPRLEYVAALRQRAATCKQQGDDRCERLQLEEAEAILENIAQNDTSRGVRYAAFYQNDRANLLEYRGKQAADLQNFDRAADFYSRVLMIRRQILSEKPTDTARFKNVALTLQRLADVRQRNHQIAAAETTWWENIQIVENLATQNPTAFESDLRRNYASASAFFIENKLFTQVNTLAERQMAFYERQAHVQSAFFLPKFFTLLAQQAAQYQRQFDGERAEIYFLLADSVGQILLKTNAENADGLMRQMIFERGEAFLLSGQIEQAAACFRQLVVPNAVRRNPHFQRVNNTLNTTNDTQISALNLAAQLGLTTCFRQRYVLHSAKNDRDSLRSWLRFLSKHFVGYLDETGRLREQLDDEMAFEESASPRDFDDFKNILFLKFQTHTTPDARRRLSILQQILSKSKELWQKDTTNAFKKRLYTEGSIQFGEALIEAAEFGRAEKNFVETLQLMSDRRNILFKNQAHATILQGRITAALPMYNALFSKNDSRLTGEITTDLAHFVAQKWLKDGERQQVLRRIK